MSDSATPIDPVKDPRWHQATSAPSIYTLRWRTAALVPMAWIVALVVLCVSIIGAALFIRNSIENVPVVYSPDTSQLIQTTSVRIATDGQLKDFGEYITTLGETWTWENVQATGTRIEPYIHPTMRETARQRYAEFATYATEKMIGRVASPVRSQIREKTTETAVIVVPYLRHEFTVLRNRKNIFHGTTERVLTLTVVQDLSNDSNVTGIYILSREDATRSEYAVKYPDPFPVEAK